FVGANAPSGPTTCRRERPETEPTGVYRCAINLPYRYKVESRTLRWTSVGRGRLSSRRSATSGRPSGAGARRSSHDLAVSFSTHLGAPFVTQSSSPTAILGLGTALPENRMTQDEAVFLAENICARNDDERRLVKALYRKAGVKQRFTAL